MVVEVDQTLVVVTQGVVLDLYQTKVVVLVMVGVEMVPVMVEVEVVVAVVHQVYLLTLSRMHPIMPTRVVSATLFRPWR